MARRNPNVSPVLSARGYEGEILWPKYTPGGGVNSGSEFPARPRNTLQSNNSNLVERYNPYRYNPEEAAPAKPRLTEAELAEKKAKAVGLLGEGMSHADVRKAMGDVPFPLYMAILRSGRSARQNASHDPNSQSLFLRMPIEERKALRKKAIQMLEAGKGHKATREGLKIGYKTYLGILRTIPNPHRFGPL